MQINSGAEYCNQRLSYFFCFIRSLAFLSRLSLRLRTHKVQVCISLAFCTGTSLLSTSPREAAQDNYTDIRKRGLYLHDLSVKRLLQCVVLYAVQYRLRYGHKSSVYWYRTYCTSSCQPSRYREGDGHAKHAEIVCNSTVLLL